MNKRVVLMVAAALMVLGSAAVFAKGQSEKIEIKGKLQGLDERHPVLEAGDKKYELMVPPHLLFQVDLKEGQEIQVTGYKVPGPYWEKDKDKIYLMVTEATIDGKKYDLADYRGYGPGGGMMGGPRGNWRRGPGQGPRW